VPPAAKKPYICKAEIKNESTLKVEPCGNTLVSDGLGGWRCPKRDEHVLKYKTGFCANGDCEGSAKKSPSGKSRKTCDWWKRCPCTCHAMYDMMFSTAGMERQLVDNSGYSADVSEFKMPTLEERIAAHALSMPHRPDTPTVIESHAPAVVPVMVARSFTPTRTGRAARGELGSWVQKVCDVWAVDEDEQNWNCTPAYIAERVAKNEGFGKPPSVGAVDAVLKRWEAVGFAEVGRKPTRFLKYTSDGIRLGLEGCIERAKRAKKSQAAEANRSFRR
jgi:hypothetical protein